jgi:hypothetical protein
MQERLLLSLLALSGLRLMRSHHQIAGRLHLVHTAAEENKVEFPGKKIRLSSPASWCGIQMHEPTIGKRRPGHFESDQTRIWLEFFLLYQYP